jgi:acyl-coenzyme A synthetase/AMP-(fatty) acid ligase
VPASGEPFNVCDYLLDRHIRAGRGDRLALTGIAGDVSYAELAERVGYAARGLRGLGLQAEQRVVMVMADSPEFVTEYPTTATGKIRRVELRAQAAVILQAAQDEVPL